VEDTAKRKGRIDILVNNAAICFYGDIFEDSLEKWRRVQAVNLEAVYWGCKLVAPHMAKQQWGRIISIASTRAIATARTESWPMRLRRGAFIRPCRLLTVWTRPRPNYSRNGTVKNEDPASASG
jgi:NAD(P)-dependent dehydrogenase (short-subunit alcohol dehydrogenase family)